MLSLAHTEHRRHLNVIHLSGSHFPGNFGQFFEDAYRKNVKLPGTNSEGMHRENFGAVVTKDEGDVLGDRKGTFDSPQPDNLNPILTNKKNGSPGEKNYIILVDKTELDRAF